MLRYLQDWWIGKKAEPITVLPEEVMDPDLVDARIAWRRPRDGETKGHWESRTGQHGSYCRCVDCQQVFIERNRGDVLPTSVKPYGNEFTNCQTAVNLASNLGALAHWYAQPEGQLFNLLQYHDVKAIFYAGYRYGRLYGERK